MITRNRIVNLMQDYSDAEPDPQLFMVPAGYKVVNETGPLTVTLPRSR